MPSLTLASTSADTRTTYGFTTEEDIKHLYAQRGFDSTLTDVSGDSEDNVINAFISDAEQSVYIRLSKYFTTAQMANSEFVKSRTTWIAAHLLSQRRGNPHYFEALYHEAIRELEAIATGELSPPSDIPLRADIIPSMSNLIVDDRFGVSKLRVRDFISVGGTYSDQHIAYAYFWGWL